uniref:Uncharacterized protein n=1 Tax=Setaria viridis TaxID=4556 RepID=A0A4U6U1Q0_SETVI|nr:hypothetical protein SEVIR_7G079500v2 [Setaria viridis]
MRTCIVLLIVAMAAVYVIVMPTVLSDADGYVQISVINGTRAQGLGRWAVYEYDSKNHARIFFNKVLRGRRMGSSWFDLIINESISDTSVGLSFISFMLLGSVWLSYLILIFYGS